MGEMRLNACIKEYTDAHKNAKMYALVHSSETINNSKTSKQFMSISMEGLSKE